VEGVVWGKGYGVGGAVGGEDGGAFGGGEGGVFVEVVGLAGGRVGLYSCWVFSVVVFSGGGIICIVVLGGMMWVRRC